jgi:hypothetical protein
MSPDQRFSELARSFEGQPGVALPGEPGLQGFGASALKVNGKIFAMLSGSQLVVKLPRQRVAALIADGRGEPFDANKGKPMKEWLKVSGSSDLEWRDLATEALRFVGT